MAKAQKEVQQVPGGFRPVVFVEYPLTSALCISPERYLTGAKRVTLAVGDIKPTRDQAEAQFPVLFQQYKIRN